MIDGHCHLDLFPNPTQVAQEVAERGLSVISVTTTPSAFLGTAALAGSYREIYTALGLHPQLAAERQGELHLFEELVQKTRFVGEIGLDGSPENAAFYEAQIRVFRHILVTCRRSGGRILSIHSRRAASHVLKELREAGECGTPILHWFSGTARELRDALASGVWFSVGYPMLTTARGRSIIEALPREKVITETDGPFVLRNGKPTYPWCVDDAIPLLGEIWKLPSEEVAALTQRNFDRLLES